MKQVGSIPDLSVVQKNEVRLKTPFEMNSFIFEYLDPAIKTQLDKADSIINTFNANCERPFPEVAEILHDIKNIKSEEELKSKLAQINEFVLNPIMKIKTPEDKILHFLKERPELSSQVKADIDNAILNCYNASSFSEFCDFELEINSIVSFCDDFIAMRLDVNRYLNSFSKPDSEGVWSIAKSLKTPEISFIQAKDFLVELNEIVSRCESELALKKIKQDQEIIAHKKQLEVKAKIQKLLGSGYDSSSRERLDVLYKQANMEGDSVESENGEVEFYRPSLEYFDNLDKQVDRFTEEAAKIESDKKVERLTEVAHETKSDSTSAIIATKPIYSNSNKPRNFIQRSKDSVKKLLNSRSASMVAGGLLGLGTSLTVQNIAKEPQEVFLSDSQVQHTMQVMDYTGNKGNSFAALEKFDGNIKSVDEFAIERAKSISNNPDVQKQKAQELIDQISLEKNSDNAIRLLNALIKVQPDRAEYLSNAINAIEKNKMNDLFLLNFIPALIGGMVGDKLKKDSMAEGDKTTKIDDQENIALTNLKQLSAATEPRPVYMGGIPIMFDTNQIKAMGYENQKLKKAYGSLILEKIRSSFKLYGQSDQVIMNHVVKEISNLINTKKSMTPEELTAAVDKEITGVWLSKLLENGKISTKAFEDITAIIEFAKLNYTK